jgi:hypothetical protein
MTSHAALTASPRLSATIANETAPNRAIAVHKTFVCHAELLKVAPIDSSRTAAGFLEPLLQQTNPARNTDSRDYIAACRSYSFFLFD